MIRRLISALCFFGLALSLPLVAVASEAVSAAPDTSGAFEIPEKDGTYDEPGRPGVKVRVFVHKEAKPRIRQLPAPSLVCGLADDDSSAVVAAAGWKLPSSWTYNLNPASAPLSVGPSNFSTIAANSFADWTGAVAGRVTVGRGANTSKVRSAYDGQNIVAWGNAAAGTLGVTYIRYLSSSGLVVDVDTILNKKYPWSWANSTTCADPNYYDAENILTHEIGHWFGLDDEYSADFVDATMFGYGRLGEVKKNTLTSGDIAGAVAIYP